jgi:hypothetical protein
MNKTQQKSFFEKNIIQEDKDVRMTTMDEVESFYSATDTSQIIKTRNLNINCKEDILVELKNNIAGLTDYDLENLYPGISLDVFDLILTAKIIAIKIPHRNANCYFSIDGNDFLTQLTGTFSVLEGGNLVKTSEDVRCEIRRGDVIQIGGTCYRVSLAKESDIKTLYASSLSILEINKQKHLNNPYSRSSLSDIENPLITNKKEVTNIFDFTRQSLAKSDNNYLYEFSDKIICLDRPYEGPSADNIPAYKYGTTNDISKLWRNISSQKDAFVNVEFDQEIEAFDQLLLTSKIVSEELLGKYNASENKEKDMIKELDRRSREKPRKRRTTKPRIDNTNRHMLKVL